MASAAPSIPVIDTPNTILRAFRLDDFDAHAAFWANKTVTRFIGGRPFTREEAWDRYLRYAGLWPVLGYGFWVVEDKVTGRLIGNAGFHDLKRSFVPSIEGLPEAGWALHPAAQGRGIATEVVRAMHQWADATLPGGHTVCIIDPDNGASLRVAEKCGYRERLRTIYRDEPTVLLERRAAAAVPA